MDVGEWGEKITELEAFETVTAIFEDLSFIVIIISAYLVYHWKYILFCPSQHESTSPFVPRNASRCAEVRGYASRYLADDILRALMQHQDNHGDKNWGKLASGPPLSSLDMRA